MAARLFDAETCGRIVFMMGVSFERSRLALGIFRAEIRTGIEKAFAQSEILIDCKAAESFTREGGVDTGLSTSLCAETLVHVFLFAHSLPRPGHGPRLCPMCCTR